MKYNEKYDLYIDDDYVIYYWDKKLDKLMQRKIYKNKGGYLAVQTKIGKHFIHRVIYETFVGPIPDGYEIDHMNTIKTDNRLDNLRCVTHKENMNNPLTINANKGKTRNSVARTEFGIKFKEHYGKKRRDNNKLYMREYNWFHYYGKCRWE